MRRYPSNETFSGSNQEIAALLYAEQLELSQQNDNVEEAVAAIIQDVRLRGDEACVITRSPLIG